MRLPRGALAALGALILLVSANVLFTPNFAGSANALNILWQASSVAIVAVGMTLVIATGGIDLSVGSVMALAAATASVSLEHEPAALAVVLGLTAGALLGCINGVLASRPRVQPIVVTLATLIAGRGLAQVVSHDGQLVPIRSAAFEALGRGRIAHVPVAVLIAAAIAAGIAFVMWRGVFGRQVLAVGGNRRAAWLAGIPVSRTIVTVYVASGVLAAVAGMLEAARVGASDAAKIGVNMELDAIAAVVVGGNALMGGRATIVGTVVGALLMQVIATSFNMLLVPYAWALVCKAAIIVVAVGASRLRVGTNGRMMAAA